jgi:hypothetical protein
MTSELPSPARPPAGDRNFALTSTAPTIRGVLQSHLLLLGVLCLGLFVTGIGWALFGARLSSRAMGAEASAREVSRIWGGALLQPHPELRWRRADAATVELARGDLSRTQVKAVLDASYRRRGITEYPGYEATFEGTYTFVNPSDAAFVAFSVGLPTERDSLMLRDLRLLIDGKEDVEHTEYTPDRVVWTGTVAAGHASTFVVGYRARGLERFGYTLAPKRDRDATAERDQPIRPVSAFELDLTVRNARGTLDFPVGAMAPTLDEPVADGRHLLWKVDRLLTAFDVGVVLPDTRGVEVSLHKLTANAFWFEGLYGIGLFFVLAAASRRARALHAAGLLGAYFLFFPLTTYLAAYLSWPWALGLSFTGLSALVVVHVLRFVGRRAAMLLGLNQLFFLGAPSVAYLVPGPGGSAGTHTGLILVLAAFGALAVGLQVLGQATRWLREKEDAAPGVELVQPQLGSQV